MAEDRDIEGARIELDRDVFVRSLLRELTGTLEDVVGADEAAGYVSVVVGRMGDRIDGAYRKALAVEALDRHQVGRVLVDFKRRIQGDFYIVEEREDRIVLGNRRCPFGEDVKDRPSLCMMTSNVFGRIAANNLGYARVDIEEAFAYGDDGCRVVVHLKPVEDPRVGAREYFGKDDV